MDLTIHSGFAHWFHVVSVFEKGRGYQHSGLGLAVFVSSVPAVVIPCIPVRGIRGANVARVVIIPSPCLRHTVDFTKMWIKQGFEIFAVISTGVPPLFKSKSYTDTYTMNWRSHQPSSRLMLQCREHLLLRLFFQMMGSHKAFRDA